MKLTRFLFLFFLTAAYSTAAHAMAVESNAAELTEKEAAAVKDAIKQLGSDEFDLRQKASDALIAFGKKAIDPVTVAQKVTTDSEVRRRTKVILAKIADMLDLEGLTTLPSGLQYKIIKEGEGESPDYGDIVVVNFTGKLKDGAEFESSYKRGAPAQFQANCAAKGLTEGLRKMKPGAKWILIIPPQLAWGEDGQPAHDGMAAIPPNATLIYRVELISVKTTARLMRNIQVDGNGDGL